MSAPSPHAGSPPPSGGASAAPGHWRRVLALALLVASMVALRWVSGWINANPDAAGYGFTFAGVGFVVLAAYALADLVGLAGIPRVTGYILAGVALGPQVADILSSSVVGDLQVFNTLALALIALEAGLELRLDGLRRVGRSLGAIVALKVPLAWLLVGGAFLLGSGLLPGADSLSTGALVTIALVLGALSVGTSPAVSVAVISETGAEGRTPDLILALAVFKDLVMIVMLALAMALGHVLLTPGAAFDVALLGALGKKILLSLAAGAALGGLLIAYMRWVRWELILVLLILGYGGAWLSDLLHLKMLLVFIGAGFVVGNFSPYGHDLHKPLALLALPVFMLFFTTVGAGLDLARTWAVLPLAGLLFGARLVMLYTATRLGGRLAGDSRAFANNAWLGFVSQAGVALGLLLMAQVELPEIAAPLQQVAVALIALNLLIGPILLRVTLARGPAAEAAGADGAQAGRPSLPPWLVASVRDRADEAASAGLNTAAAGGTSGGEVVERAGGAGASTAGAPHRAPDSEVHGAVLRDVVADLAGALDGATDRIREELLEPWVVRSTVGLPAPSAGQASASSAGEAAPAGGQGDAVTLSGASDAVAEPALALVPSAAVLRSVTGALRDRLHGLPGAVALPTRPEQRIVRPGAPLRRRVWAAMWALRPQPRRRVAVRRVARAALEGRFVTSLADALDALGRAEAERLVLLEGALASAGLSADEPGAVEGLLRDHVRRAADALDRGLVQARAEALDACRRGLEWGGTPADPAPVRYVDVAAVVDDALLRLDTRGSAWDRVLAGFSGRARLRAALAGAERAVRREAAPLVRAWFGDGEEGLTALVARVAREVAAAHEGLLETLLSADSSSAAATLDARIAALERLVAENTLPAVDALRAAHDPRDGGLQRLVANVERRLAALDGVSSAVGLGVEPKQIHEPGALTLAQLGGPERAASILLKELRWAYAEAAGRAKSLLDQVALRLGELVGLVSQGLTEVADELRDRLTDPAPEDGCTRACGHVDRASVAARALVGDVEDAVAGMPELVEELTREAFSQALVGAVGGGLAAPRGGARAGTRGGVAGLADDVLGAWRRLWGALAGAAELVRASGLARRARVRVGRERVDPAQMAAEVAALEATEEDRARLPYVLARLLDQDAGVVGAWAQTPGSAEERLAAARARFDAGEPVAVLVVGDAGSGKTSLARAALARSEGPEEREASRGGAEAGDYRLAEVALRPIDRDEVALCASVGAEVGVYGARRFADLRDALLAAPRGRLLLLDGLEFALDRTPKGLAFLRALLEVIRATRHRHLWAASITTPAARLLRRAVSLEGAFTDRVELPPRGAGELEELLEGRCRLAGMTVAYPQDPRLPRRPIWRRLAGLGRPSRPEDLRRRFYRRLARVTRGNPRDAMTRWVQSVQAAEGEVVRLGPVASRELPWFPQLGADAHRLLALAVLSGAVDGPAAARSLRWAPARARAALGLLEGVGLLVPLGEGQLRVRPAAWGAIVELLMARNLLPGDPGGTK